MPMGKVRDALRKIPLAYYNWKKRNENLTAFLKNSADNTEKLNRIDSSVTKALTDIEDVESQVQNLGNIIEQINGRIETMGRGTKMELFDTLHARYVKLVKKRGWASNAEKREVNEIYHIYHDELHGNGQGERYYNAILDLPESDEEESEGGDKSGKI